MGETWPMRCEGKNSCRWVWDQPLTEAARMPVHCPRCRKTRRVPPQAWGAEPRPVVRFRRSPARRKAATRADPPAALIAGPEAADLDPWQLVAETISNLIGGGPPAGRALEPTAVIPPSWPQAPWAGQDVERPRPLVPRLLTGRQREPELDWLGTVPQAARWCAACRAERKRALAKYQAELTVAPFAADLCGTCLARLWREVPQVVTVGRRLPALAKGAPKPAEDALLLRLAAAGLRVPGLAGLIPA
jgi:hypothetical protein